MAYQVKLFTELSEKALEKSVNDFLAVNANNIKEIEEQSFTWDYEYPEPSVVGEATKSVKIFKCRIFYSTTPEGTTELED